MGTFVKRGRELENQTRKTFVDKSINVKRKVWAMKELTKYSNRLYT